MAVVLPAYIGVTVTLPDTASHNLLALVTAIEPNAAAILQNVGQLALQADLGNGSNVIYVGDLHVSPTRRAYDLLAHDQNYRYKEAMNVPLGAIWVLGQAAGMVLNVEIIP